ncbi:MAG TPA: protein kinase [Ktedonobacteraceae bacterium]|nr:protein kinase [Ktedonobacteraceae bacterium]
MSLEGLQLGRYHLMNLVGSGNMGEVYLAEDTQLSRQVAIKLMRSEGSSYPNADAVKEAARLFQREAKAIAAMDHPNILPLYDFGEQITGGTPTTYMVMPLRQDGSLASWLQQRGTSNLLSFEEVGYFVRQAAGALQYAHDHQITHQDVKPSNFLIRQYNQDQRLPDLQLADFGIAKFSTGTASASHTIRGTPAYMAPEQWSGTPVQASDQYALAVMAYELLTGRVPFQGTLQSLMYQHLQEQPKPPSGLNPHLPPEVDAVFQIALAKQPEARFARISAFAEALRQALRLPATGTVTTSTDPTLIGISPASISNDVHTSLTLSMEEARKGTQRVLTLPNGRHISVAVPPDAYDGQVLRLDGLGQPSSSGGPVGALLLKIAITQVETIPVITTREETAPTLAMVSPPPPATYEAASVGRQRQGIPVSVAILLLVLVLVLAGGGFLYFTKAPSSQGNQPGTSTTGNTRNLSSTPQHTGTIAATPTNQPTATATKSTGGVPNPYTQSGSLVLSDPLTSNNLGWDTGINNHNASCEFTSQGLQVIQPAQGFFHGCIAKNTDFTNFVYEVQMNMISGDYGGILFCANKTQGTYYYFYIKPGGNYLLQAFSGDSPVRALISGSSSAITTGLPSTNVLAVVVQNGNITLFVNQTRIISMSDATYTHGQIGVFTGNDTNSAETIFSNVKVWQL